MSFVSTATNSDSKLKTFCFGDTFRPCNNENMSVLFKLHKLRGLEKQFSIQNIFQTSTAYYSRKSDSKKLDSPYKVVKAKVRLEDESGYLGNEGGPNWELFAPKGYRFYLPGSVGPAWQGASTTISTEFQLEQLVDFESKAYEKLHISTKECPTLIRKSLHEIFPAPEVVSGDGLTLITLKYNRNQECEQGARKFVLAAREICSRLRLNGYWADFMNPFSGKPFYSYASGRNLYKIDSRFRGLGMKFKRHDQCLIISSDDESAFSGNVFTNAPSDLIVLKSIIDE